MANQTTRFSNLTDMQYKETLSMLTSAAENGCINTELCNVAERYIWNAYQVHEPITVLAGLCFRAQFAAGAL